MMYRFICILIFLLCLTINLPAFEQLKDGDGYNISTKGYPFEFPRDHGSHPGFKIEWWYLTGNLSDESGNEFGYQLTIFRNQLTNDRVKSKPNSDLTLEQLYIGHFAISNIAEKEHREQLKLARPALGGVSASETSMNVQVHDWRIVQNENDIISIAASSEKGMELQLELEPQKDFVIHGEDGIHLKTNNEKNASHYISFTRLKSSGSVIWDGDTYHVGGLSWMDHEFGSSWLDSEDEGWDWMAVQLDNEIDLMIYRIRRRDGSSNPYAIGSLVKRDGTLIELPFSEYSMTPVRYWKSEESGAEYPVEWKVEIPKYDAVFNVSARFDNQEMNLGGDDAASTYWEGAIGINGTWQGEETTGKGYLEMVGYSQAMEEL